ncbi:MAG: helix-turn-helix domain-containing protein [Bacteroidia bacterium]|nr:helix-turn-helix domain-containing protein [Bacteroidia bacterium]
MFKIEFIYELLSGDLTEKGYKHFLSGISALVKKSGWSKSIIISEFTDSDYWTANDIKELTHQFIEHSIEKRKFSYLDKIPENYLSYYFTQIFISFVANRISEEQQKNGLSFEKCKELVDTIIIDKYIINQIDSIDYVFTTSFDGNDINSKFDFDKELKYLSHIPILEDTKHFKPLVASALEDIFNLINMPVATSKLVELVFNLFDQKVFSISISEEETDELTYYEIDTTKFEPAIRSIVAGFSKDDSKLISEYLFQTKGEVSLSVLAEKYGIPKSTLHFKIEHFKKKLLQTYTPENEEEGVLFLKNIFTVLDEMGK